MVKELWYRHLIKTGTWRVIAFITLGLISYFLTGSLALATSIALADWLIKTTLYFMHELAWSKSSIGRRTLSCKKGALIWFTGLSGSGKTTLADEVARLLEKRMVKTKRLDGDVARRTFSNNLGFSAKDRAENCRRAAHVGSYLKEDNVVLASFISPYRVIQEYICRMGGLIVHVDCPIKVCASRDPKGMYAQLKDGKFKGSPFTGMHSLAPYENPIGAEVIIKTNELSLTESAAKVILFLEARGFIE